MFSFTGMADLSDTSRWWFNCVWVSESVCPRTCRHIARRMMNGWLWNYVCMYVGYHDANNVSNCGGDPVNQLKLKKRLQKVICHFVF